MGIDRAQNRASNTRGDKTSYDVSHSSPQKSAASASHGDDEAKKIPHQAREGNRVSTRAQETLFNHNFGRKTVDTAKITLPRLLKSKHVGATFGTLLFQQTIVASSNIWLLRATEALATGGAAVGVNVGLFLGSMLLPYLPGAASLIFKERWKSDVVERYMDLMIQQQRGQIGTWNDKELSEEVATTFAVEAEDALDSGIDAIYNVTGSVLNIAFGLISLSILLDPKLFVAGMLSVVVGWASLRASSATQQVMAERAQEARIDLSSHAQKFSDHVMVGNTRHVDQWVTALKDRFHHARDRHIAAEILANKVSLKTTFFSCIPVLSVLAHHLWMAQGDGVAQARTLVIIPRLLQSLLFVEALCSEISLLPGQLEHLRGVRDALDIRGTIDFSSRIDRSKLTLTHAGEAVDINAIIENPTLLRQPGRWTLRGDNQAGKSTLLYAVKLFFGEEAYYLPARHKIVHGEEQGSTGQQAIGLLNNLLDDQNDTQLLLLDEWDGNLSATNRGAMEVKLARSAERRPILDVTHFEATDNSRGENE